MAYRAEGPVPSKEGEQQRDLVADLGLDDVLELVQQFSNKFQFARLINVLRV